MGSGGGLKDNNETASIKDKKLRILLVDDRSDYREGMSFMLAEKYDAEITDVDSGPEAIKVVGAGAVFDLIFLDIRMWPMGGFETYRELMAVDPECPVVMMSAHAGNVEYEEAESLGVELLQKPIPDEAIMLILSRIERRQP